MCSGDNKRQRNPSYTSTSQRGRAGQGWAAQVLFPATAISSRVSVRIQLREIVLPIGWKSTWAGLVASGLVKGQLQLVPSSQERDALACMALHRMQLKGLLLLAWGSTLLLELAQMAIYLPWQSWDLSMAPDLRVRIGRGAQGGIHCHP